ncbi:dual oxidase maturation factor 2 [Columba livia]|uniref:Dual oxidase maturation factor 2 n=1 Tax=Columba livia TaxID=8932 RepID=A0A2I0LP09_COLLI|nr:dual oxidase maturation factor 2 [Columba livia]XP_021152630.1 dual oxidase maturation factor 2 [Columba livia]XP_021152631.1 dual oxidase maturation factor 2 [Columba livia]PKK19163.1 dual oxidase maturation factor 2 [Columba livia]
MTLFDGIYPFYPQLRKASVFNVSTIIVIVVFLTFACSFLLITPGIRGRARLYWTLRVLLSLIVGVVIVTVQFTGDWETGWVTANTSYKSFSQALVNVDIGLHVGLAGVNVTLMGNPVNQVNETINYNEHFDWSFSADYDHSYGEGLEKGLPNPILYVAEKFTTQSPCNLHRQYRISGHYASATLWVAFCTWLISNMLFSMPVLVYGGYMLLITGAFMIFSLISFSTVRNSPMCPIHFGTAVLHIGYGGSFWLTLVIGLLCLVAGIAVVALHYFNLDLLKTFFDLREDKAEEYQEMTQVYVNSHCGNKGLCPSQPSKLNSI